MRTLYAIGLFLLCVGCEEQTPKEETAYERDLAPLLLACTGCHGPNGAEAGLDLTDPFALADAPSTQVQMKLIEPGHHLRSYLWHKVAGTQGISGGLGQRMPVNHGWTDDQVELLGRWIDLGMPR